MFPIVKTGAPVVNDPLSIVTDPEPPAPAFPLLILIPAVPPPALEDVKMFVPFEPCISTCPEEAVRLLLLVPDNAIPPPLAVIPALRVVNPDTPNVPVILVLSAIDTAVAVPPMFNVPADAVSIEGVNKLVSERPDPLIQKEEPAC